MKKTSVTLKIIAFVLLIFIWDYIFISYRELPATVPFHFGLDGTPDGFGPKITYWILAGTATLIYFILYVISKRPDSPLVTIPQNIKNHPSSAVFLDFINVICMLMFSVIVYESIQVSLGESPALGFAVPALIVILLFTIILMKMYSVRLSKSETQSEDYL